ncbi:hypothetical protein CW751_13610 [Brumimicrobium salinarum]|uniref:Uncharacterized protein n=1 Tax=Brumimicrobium salinarum TaxID=2058658 RepID=A0A2I0QZM1_9FLAO|nr:hypothetical protein [Brumimicrobium salinarum]PKR79757.1 hypothetical protein CW751_13610 [Brumimicrobium salinarum]
MKKSILLLGTFVLLCTASSFGQTEKSQEPVTKESKKATESEIHKKAVKAAPIEKQKLKTVKIEGTRDKKNITPRPANTPKK